MSGMKAYVITSGVIFALVTVVHILRIAVESRRLATEQVYIFLTLASAALAVWSWSVLRRFGR